ncbi:MAG: asparagine synthase (glutamine-hydrolyzing) [Bacteroidota bacterium]
MCGIAGYFSKNNQHRLNGYLEDAIQTLSKRGPDIQQCVILSPQVGFAHARLSIIDPSQSANQPMSDKSGRYTIIFNGEIFNFRELRKKFLFDLDLTSTSDTEVLLNLYIKLGKVCLEYLNGFYAFAIFDNLNHEIFLARDRFGIKPLHVYTDDTMVVIASEMKAIMSFPIKKEIDYETLALYLQLNYVPGTNCILKNVQKIRPGYFAIIDDKGIFQSEKYYSIPFEPGKKIHTGKENYESIKAELHKLVEEAVERRLVSDVPLGAFLSGGIDSSIVTACASKYVTDLNTFSIGFKDEPYFDETHYANLVARKFKTNHTVFSISNDEMLANVFSVLDYLDEPFADSSAIAVYLLSSKTRESVTVALSGDGGDELFAGYNKHRAEFRAQDKNLINVLIALGLPFLKSLPKSRHSKFTNLFRQAQRYGEGLQLAKDERYWRWCILNSQQSAIALLKNKKILDESELENKKRFVLNTIKEEGDLNDVLLADMQMVLPSDMLTKVDLMSMANSLEVRVPLLDYTLVDYAFTLPVSYKIDTSSSKKILKDAFRAELPVELFNRPKSGFEVPLLKWMNTGLRALIENQLLEKNFIKQQNIFDFNEIEKLREKLFSKNPGDTPAIVWGLIVFQYWYKKYFAPDA